MYTCANITHICSRVLTQTYNARVPRNIAPCLSSSMLQRNVPEGKLFTREQSVGYLLAILDRLGMEDNGKFFAWDGKEIPF